MAFPLIPLALAALGLLVVVKATKKSPTGSGALGDTPPAQGPGPIVPASAFVFQDGLYYFSDEYARMGAYKLLRYTMESKENVELRADGVPLIERYVARLSITAPIAIGPIDPATKQPTIVTPPGANFPKTTAGTPVGWLMGRNAAGARILATTNLAQVASPYTKLPGKLDPPPAGDIAAAVAAQNSAEQFVAFYNDMNNFPERISIIAIDQTIPVGARPYARMEGGQGYAVLVSDPQHFKTDASPTQFK